MNSKDSLSNSNPTEFNPFSGAEILNVIPTTESQMEIWLSCTLGGDDANRAFNESISLKFKGNLNTKAFEESLVSVIYRHEALHSSFSADGSQMIVFKEVPLNYDYIDISNLEKSEVDAKLNEFVKEDANYIFDLLNGPLIKFKLIKLSAIEYYFIFNAHHIICDGWSMGVILQDLSRIYSSFSKNEIPELDPPDSFVKYAIEQVEFVKSESYRNNVIYWVNKFKTIPILDLPIDNPRVNPRTFNASRYDYQLSIELVNAIKQIGVKHGCSLVNTMLAAFEIYISAISGQDEIVVGLPAADQSASGYYNLVGHCVNLLPIKSVVDTELNFIEFLKERKSAILDAYDHQQFTFGSLLKTLKIKRDPSRVPLVPVVFNIDMEMDSGVNFEGLKYHIISNPKQFRNFELSINLWGSETAMQLEWSYNSDIFNKETIVKMMAEFERLLLLIIKDPNGKIEFLINRKTSSKFHRTYSNKKYNEAHQQYWLNNLKEELAALELPRNKYPANDHQYDGKVLSFDFIPEHVKGFKDYLAKSGLQMQEGMLTLLSVLLYRYTEQKEFIISSRLTPENIEAGSYPLRISLNPENPFLRIAAEIHQLVKEALLNNNFSMQELLQDIGSNVNSIFSLSYSFDEKNGKKTKIFKNESEINLHFIESSIGLKLSIEYDKAIFHEDTIIRMVSHIRGLLSEVLETPELPIQFLDYIGSEENKTILEGFNGNKFIYPEDSTVIDIFEEHVAMFPDNIALVFDNKKYTYKEVNERANRLGDFLRKKYKVLPNELIGLKLERNEWMVISILGILKSGAAYLPIDPKYPSDRINYILKDSECKFLIDQTFIRNYLIESSNFSQNNPVKCNQPNDLLYVIYTSGSTGTPKGVMVENASLVNYIHSICKEYSFTPSDRVIQISNIVFDASAEQIFLSLLTGASLYVYDNLFSENSVDLSEFIEKNKITHLHSVPTLLQQIDFSKITSLKRVVSAGEVCPLNLSDRLNENIHFYNKYGPTEATISCSIQLVDRSLPVRNVIPIGKPIGNVEMFILDSNNLVVPIGIQGEICIGGKGLARGYLNNPSTTSEKFIDNLYKNGERIYKTGDMGRWLPDGTIEYTGRRDYQVKIRGYRIELGEIESVINAFPFIKNSVVIVKEELNGNQNLVAFVKCNQMVNFKELRGHLNEKLPNYMIPSHFIQIDEIPLTSSGKSDRENLKKRILHSNVELNPLDMPTSPEEKLVAKIWSDLLGMEHINKSDNFFELGGHSLIAIKVIIRLENETGYKLPMSSLFEYPTIESIAKLITSKEELNKWKALVPIKPKGNKIPLYLIHGGGLGVLVFNNIANHFDEDQPVYGLQALGMDGKEEPLSSVEEMASYYISEIIEQNADGPYAIAGHSAGGIVAFEMAKQLTRLNKKVDYLAVFDYDYIEIERQKSLKRKIKRKTIDFVPELIFTIKSFVKRPKKTMKHQIMIWHLRYITMLKRLGFEKKEELKGLYLHINNAKTKFEESLKKYKMEPYDGTIDLFISEDKVYYQDDPEYLGWRPFSTQPININKVKGDHDKMILPPNDKAFAKILQKRLDSCSFKFKS